MAKNTGRDSFERRRRHDIWALVRFLLTMTLLMTIVVVGTILAVE